MSIKLLDKIVIPQVEGEIDLIYGHPGGGKNTYATQCILNDLRSGYKVFATWPVEFSGNDERESLFYVLLGVFGFKRRYRVLGSSNFEYLTLSDLMSPGFMRRFFDMTDCCFYVDEAYAAPLFDSYRKTHLSPEERMAVYTTRHVNRKIVIVAQRPNAIHVSSRGLVNRFVKCEQLVPIFLARLLRFYIFVRTEYYDMIDESVDEEKPFRTRVKFMTFGNQIFRMFNSKYMRGDRGVLYPPDIKVYDVGYISRFGLFSHVFVGVARGFSHALRRFAIYRWLLSIE